MAAADESKAYATLTSDVAGAGVGAGAGSEAADTGLDTMIAEALAGIKGRVAAAAKAAGRTDSVRLIAVSKLKSNDHVMAAYNAGHRDFGENYVQELCKKAGELPSDIRWHFIGQLQSNKCKMLVGKVPNLYAVESVDSVKLANTLNKACVNAGRDTPLNVFVQVNTSEEAQKGGVAPDACIDLVKHVRAECPQLSFVGLMTIGKLGEVAAKYFETLALCREATCKELELSTSDVQLSMGMSSDFEMAVAHGATTVRVGSSIFGHR